ncbi:hypothetical protein PAL_GLEAN10020740 [Pteropus alecto]|uniref:Uncharacterized protein n=1 Tax=Pteropus alecto TaxID=9402 RepID=L5JSF5_PTEAL|nr:hypothetical protein PAL_GLEAN10020740 [Pteropus alecto]
MHACVFAERCVIPHRKESVHEDEYRECSEPPEPDCEEQHTLAQPFDKRLRAHACVRVASSTWRWAVLVRPRTELGTEAIRAVFTLQSPQLEVDPQAETTTGHNGLFQNAPR